WRLAAKRQRGLGQGLERKFLAVGQPAIGSLDGGGNTLAEDEGSDRVAILVSAEIEGLELERGEQALRLIVALPDDDRLHVVADDLDEHVNVGEAGIRAAFALTLVLAGMADAGD